MKTTTKTYQIRYSSDTYVRPLYGEYVDFESAVAAKLAAIRHALSFGNHQLAKSFEICY